jgi:tRNA G18 (ribose-2'-O)-methylase SpoU
MRKLLYEEILNQRPKIEDISQLHKNPITIVLHNIRSAYNVGSIFRTSDSAGIEKLILCGFTPHPPNKEIEKTSLDATQTVSWEYFSNTLDAIGKLKSEGKTIVAVELTDKSIDYTEIKPTDYPIALILGNEISGIDNEILKECDFAIEIPMYGVKHSLNVSVAAGIVAYQSVKIWRDSNK